MLHATVCYGRVKKKEGLLVSVVFRDSVGDLEERMGGYRRN